LILRIAGLAANLPLNLIVDVKVSLCIKANANVFCRIISGDGVEQSKLRSSPSIFVSTNAEVF
jgi:hypothetical protein